MNLILCRHYAYVCKKIWSTVFFYRRIRFLDSEFVENLDSAPEGSDSCILEAYNQ